MSQDPLETQPPLDVLLNEVERLLSWPDLVERPGSLEELSKLWRRIDQRIGALTNTSSQLEVLQRANELIQKLRDQMALWSERQLQQAQQLDSHNQAVSGYLRGAAQTAPPGRLDIQG